MLRLQHLTRLTDAVTWSRGLYEFRAGDTPKTNESFSLWLIFQSGLFRRLGREKIVESAKQHKESIVTYRPSIIDPLIVASPDLFAMIGAINNTRTVAQLASEQSNQMLFYTNMLLLRELGVIDFRKNVLRKAA
jgi:hypothetical protein